MEALLTLLGVIVGSAGTFLMEARRSKWTEDRERRFRWETTQQQWLLELQDTCGELGTMLDKYTIERRRAQANNPSGLWVGSEQSESMSNQIVHLSGRIDTLSSRIQNGEHLSAPVEDLSNKLVAVFQTTNEEENRVAVSHAINTLEQVIARAGEILQSLGNVEADKRS